MSEKQEKNWVRLDDIVLSRDESGRVEPIEAYWDYVGGHVSFRPITYGYAKKAAFSIAEPVSRWTDAQKICAVKDHFVSPSFVELEDDEFHDGMEADTLDQLCRILVMYSIPTFRLRRLTHPVAEMSQAEKAIETLKEIMTEAEENRKTSEDGAE